jgi:hypothetical protein
MSASRALFLLLPIVIFNALSTELVETLPHIHWVLKHIEANRAKQCGFFDFLEERKVYIVALSIPLY